MPEPLKHRIDAAAIERVAALIDGRFDRDGFVAAARDGLEPLELKARVAHVADALRAHLAPRWEDALAQLTGALPPEPTTTDGLTDGMGLWPLLSVIERHGLDAPEASLAALGRLTPHWTAEFAVRPYFARDPDAMVRWVERWSRDANVHRRRLASEGSRPRLPWGMALRRREERPDEVVPALERLADDPSAYVRRSVANHLNDLTVSDPSWVLQLIEGWLEARPARSPLARHALRGLLRRGDPRAFALLGMRPFDGRAALSVSPARLALGQTLTLELSLESASGGRVRVDYGLHAPRADGTLGLKVFRWTERELAPGDAVALQRRHTLREVTTRTTRPGEHAVDVRVNGEVVARAAFTVVAGPTSARER